MLLPFVLPQPGPSRHCWKPCYQTPALWDVHPAGEEPCWASAGISVAASLALAEPNPHLTPLQLAVALLAAALAQPSPSPPQVHHDGAGHQNRWVGWAQDRSLARRTHGRWRSRWRRPRRLGRSLGFEG